MNFDVNFRMDDAFVAEMGEFTRGPRGADGITPHIGENGNWYLGEEDTGVKAQGPAGSVAVDNTTIKLNDQGQLTLALSNANGVSF